MEPKRKRELALAGIVVLLGVVAYAAYETLATPSRPSAARAVASNEEGRRPGRSSQPAQSVTPSAEAPQVNLDALGEGRPKPDPAGRDLFRFRVKPPPPPPPAPKPVTGPQLPPPLPGPPPVPPITLKFIGIVESPPPGTRVAVLSDGRGAPVYGHEGDTVLGQYRIVRIGVESVEMSYLDGRGRQTIRLSGS